MGVGSNSIIFDTTNPGFKVTVYFQVEYLKTDVYKVAKEH